jgi:hypothetical protein
MSGRWDRLLAEMKRLNAGQPRPQSKSEREE